MASASNPFWAYSLRLYRRPGVAPACLALQESLGLDVNLLLFCLWTASRGVKLASRDMAAAVGVSAMWSANVVKPLRGVRRFLKPMQLPGFRGQVAKIELAGEKLEQMLLVGLLAKKIPAGKGSGDLAVRHLRDYAAQAKLDIRPADIKRLLAILIVAFPAADPLQLRRALA